MPNSCGACYSAWFLLAERAAAGTELGTGTLLSDIGHRAATRRQSAVLAVCNELLYLAYRGSGSDDLWYNVFDGSSWLANDIKITQGGHTKTSCGPAFAVYNGLLISPIAELIATRCGSTCLTAPIGGRRTRALRERPRAKRRGPGFGSLRPIPLHGVP